MEDVRRLLGWGQTCAKDQALTTASVFGSDSFLLRQRLQSDWLDDEDIGWLLVVIKPSNVEYLSARLRNSERTAHLILHDYCSLGRCGPMIRKNKRIWLSALACIPEDYPVGRLHNWTDVSLHNDPAISAAWYHRFVVNELVRQPPSYDINSSINALELFSEELRMKIAPYEEKVGREQKQIDELQNWKGDKAFGMSCRKVWIKNKLATLKVLKPLHEEYTNIQYLIATKRSQSNI